MKTPSSSPIRLADGPDPVRFSKGSDVCSFLSTSNPTSPPKSNSFFNETCRNCRLESQVRLKNASAQVTCSKSVSRCFVKPNSKKMEGGGGMRGRPAQVVLLFSSVSGGGCSRVIQHCRRVSSRCSRGIRRGDNS